MRSIRVQVSAWVICAVLVLSLLAAIFCFRRTRAILQDQFDAGLVSRAKALCALVQRDPNGTFEVTSSDALVPKAHHLASSTEFFQIWDAAGHSLRRSASLNGGDLHIAAGSESMVFWNLTLPNGAPGRAVRFEFLPAVEDEAPEVPPANAPLRSPQERVTLALALDLTPVHGVEKVLLSSIALAAFLLCGGLLIVLPLAVSRGLAPLRRVSERAAAIDASTLSGRFDADAMPVELRPICSRLNDLLGRLERSFVRERRFSADVAHELRTPIAELRSMAEVMTRWPPDSQSSKQAFRDALDIARQMEAVVSTLLVMARCESGKLNIELRPVDLCDAVRNNARVLHAAALERKLAVSIDMPGSTFIRGEAGIVEAIVANLMSNAATHSPAGGDVRCAVELEDGKVCFRISNDAPTLSPADIQHMAEAFWRKDSARSDSSHSGLGLALVQSYARAIDAELSLGLDPDGTFTVTLRCEAFPSGRPMKGEPAIRRGTLPVSA